jgi:hypothetical protein
MDALDIERSIAAGEQALQALITFARKQAGKLEARAPAAGRHERRCAQSAAGPAARQPGADEAGGDGADQG